jgi:hypothetical protein
VKLGGERVNQKKLLRETFEDVIWMAIRYAHGRHTYAPDLVRETIARFKSVFPDFELKEDITIKPPTEEELNRQGWVMRSDWLDDLFGKEVKE